MHANFLPPFGKTLRGSSGMASRPTPVAAPALPLAHRVGQLVVALTHNAVAKGDRPDARELHGRLRGRGVPSNRRADRAVNVEDRSGVVVGEDVKGVRVL